MNIYNTQTTMSSYSNIDGDVISKEYELEFNKKNNNPGKGRIYLRNNNKKKEVFFKEGKFVDYIKSRKKSKKSLKNRIKNLTNKKKKKRRRKKKKSKETKKKRKKKK